MDYSGIIANVFGINTSPSWSGFASSFDEYAVTGFRLEFIPGSVTGTGQQLAPGNNPVASAAISPCQVFEDLNSYNISGWNTTQVLKSGTLIMVNPNESWSMIRNNRPISKSQNVSWKSTSLSTTASNGNPQCSVNFRCNLSNPVRDMGVLKCTWFITFRGLK